MSMYATNFHCLTAGSMLWKGKGRFIAITCAEVTVPMMSKLNKKKKKLNK